MWLSSHSTLKRLRVFFEKTTLWCCVEGCSSRTGQPGVRSFRFPVHRKDPGQQMEDMSRLAWVVAVRHEDIKFNHMSAKMRVGSLHFYKSQPAYKMVDSDADWAPSLRLGHALHDDVNGHVTIQKGLAFPPLQKCTTCCFQGQYHCPFCSPGFFKPTKRSRVLLHLEIHIRRACFIGEYTIHKCSLECFKRPHYHCLYCLTPVLSKQDLNRHVHLCGEKLKKTDSRGDKGAESGEMSELPSNLESDDESGDEDADVVPAPQDRTDRDRSSDASASHFLPRSKMAGSGGRRPQPVRARCHRMVQTNMEKPQDCDEFYFMNLVKMFKKLTPQKKTEVRMKIERLLFEAEFQ